MLRTVIIDDEINSRESLHTLLGKYCTGVEVVATASGVEEGVRIIDEVDPDLVMLDIQMQDGTGFDLLKQIDNPKFQLIFTTAHDEYAIKAFKFSAIDYLLKPIELEELEGAVDEVQGPTGSLGGAVGAKGPAAVVSDAADEGVPRPLGLWLDAEVKEVLVVPKLHVVARRVALDQRVLEDEGVFLAVGEHDLDLGGLGHEEAHHEPLVMA